VDRNGQPITLSGLLSVPDKPAKGVILVPHFTITSRHESPSAKITGDAEPFQDDYIILAPDYLGYGVTADSIHPYLYGSLTARHCVDMLLHADHALDSMGATKPLDSIYIVGYSQGAATALWTLKLIEEKNTNRFHVIRCFAGDGPYDVAATYDEAVAHNKVSLPLVIPMLVIGSDAAYDLNFDLNDYFTPRLQKTYARYIRDKEYRVFSLFFRMPYHRLSHWLTPEAMDKTHPIGQRLYQALQRSSLVRDDYCPDWTPAAPLFIFHSTNDDVVTIQCAYHLQHCYPDLPNVTYDFGRYGSHLLAAKRFFSTVKSQLRTEN